MAQRTSSANQAPANLAPLIAAAAVVGGLVATYFQLPGAVIIAVGVALASFLFNAPPQVNAKEPHPEPIQLQQRRWMELRWRTVFPSGDWLVNSPSQLSDFREGGKKSFGSLSRRLPTAVQPVFPLLGELIGAIAWLVVPSRFATFVAVGAGLVVLSLPATLAAIKQWVPDVDPTLDLAWLNALYAYAVIMAVDAVIRRHAAIADPSPGVTVASLSKKAAAGDGGAWRAFIGFTLLGVAIAVAVPLTLLSLEATDVFVHPWLVGIGAALAAAGGCLHGAARAAGLEAWRDQVAARAQWVPRWEGLKYPEVTMISHERVGSFVVDTFEAPPSLGSAKAINLYNSVVPYLAAGGEVNTAMLTVPATDSQGQPVAGSAHATRFRVIVAPGDAEVQTLDPSVDVEEVKLAAELGAFHAARELNAPVPILLDIQAAHTPDSTVAVWETAWTTPLASAMTVAFALGVDPENGIFSEGRSTFFGDFEQATLLDRSLPGRMEKAAYEARWAQRWTDALKMGEKQPHLQYAAIKHERLNATIELTFEPFLVGQGLSPAQFFSKNMCERIRTTLKAAPFLTVVGITGALAGGIGPGVRHAQGFAVVHAAAPVPANPADIASPGPRAREAAKWVMGGLINRAFEDAKLPYPEVITAEALTRPTSKGHVWKVHLRLYDGVTAATLKQNAPKLIQSLGGVRWLRFEESEHGCYIVMGAQPHADGVKFANPQALAYCDKLDWAQAFQNVGIRAVTDGASPMMLENGPHETNPKITRLVFAMPAGLNLGKIQEATDKLRSETANDYVDIRPAATPSQFVILAAEENPIPFPAVLDWEASADTTGKGEHSIPFAYTTDGSTVSLNWKNDFHMMVLGGSGSGKSSFMQVLTVGAILRGSDIFVMDPTKGAVDFEFAAPWIRGFAREGQHLGAGELTQLIGMEMNERKRLNGQYGVGNYRDLPEDVRPRHMFVIIDEFQSLIKEVSKGTLKAPDTTDEVELALFEQRKNINDGVRKLAMWVGKFGREARSVGITVILAGQGIKAPELEAVGLQGMKDLTLDTLLPVPVSEKFPTGWARNDELTEGDLLFAADGATTPIVGFSPVITHDELYEVVFDDGHTVTTGPGHLWLASDAKGRKRAETRRASAAAKEAEYRSIAASIPAGTLMDSATLAELHGTTREDALWRIKRFGLERAVATADGIRWLDRDESGYRILVDGAEFFSRLADVYTSAPAERVVTTVEMLNTLRRDANGKHNWTVRLAAAPDSGDVALPVDPYVLGAWLGDGSKGSGNFSAGSGAASTDETGLTDKQHLIDQLTAAGFDGHDLACSEMLVGTKGLKVKLREAGVLDRKHIPAAYKRASAAQRLALLQGLMDTDGSIIASGKTSFTQVDRRLAADFRELVESLGIKVTVHERLNAAGNLTSHFKFRTGLPVFRLPRKAARQRSTATNSISRRRRIVDIRPVATAPTRCIAVAHPEKLFLVEGFIPTHNTNFSRVALGRMTHGDMSSAFKDVSTLPNLGSNIPQGRGIFEGTSGDPLVIQSWFEPGGQDEMARRLMELVPPIDSDTQVDIAALEDRVRSAAPKAFGAVMEEFEVEEDDEETIELSADDLGLSFDDFAFDDSDSLTLDKAADSAPEVPAPLPEVAGEDADDIDAFTLLEPPTDLPFASEPEDVAEAPEDAPVDRPLFHPGQFAEMPTGLTGTVIIGSDIIFGETAPTGDGFETGWPDGDALHLLLRANPGIDEVVWVDEALAELDDIGIPREDIARDIADQHGVTLHTEMPSLADAVSESEPAPLPAKVEPPAPVPVEAEAPAQVSEPAPVGAAAAEPDAPRPAETLFDIEDFAETAPADLFAPATGRPADLTGADELFAPPPSKAPVVQDDISF